MKGAERSGTVAGPSIHPDAAGVCTACSCLCHDLDLLANAAEMPICELLSGFRKRIGENALPSQLHIQQLLVDAGKLVFEAVRHGRSIAIVGLENVAWDVQKAAIDLAEAAGAWVVRASEFSGSDSGWQAAFAQKGLRTATWGEIHQRSDALLLWYAPIWQTHPRWVERFGPRSPRSHRLAVIAADAPAPAEGWIEDQMVRVDPARACEFLRAVRVLIRTGSTEAADEAVNKVVHMIRNANWLAIVRGEDPPGMTEPFGVAETFADLIVESESEGHRRVVSTHVPGGIGEAGLDAILSMRAGLSTPMRFTPYGPVRRLGEWSADGAEFVVSFGSGLESMNIPAGVRFVPGTDLAASGSLRSPGPVVSIPVGWLGLDLPGTVIRADGVVVPVRGIRSEQSADLPAILRSFTKEVRRTIAQTAAGPEACR